MNYIDTLFSLRGKRAVITGGGGVLAGSIARALIKAGAGVSLWGRGHQSIDSAYNALAALLDTTSKDKINNRIHRQIVDTAVEVDVIRAFDATLQEWGMPDILVNGVGGNRGKGPFVKIDVELFEEIIRLNLCAGLVVPTKIIVGRWITEGVKGTVINIASMASYTPLSGVWAYDAAKAGVLNLTQACAKEFAQYGIRVNALAPGFFLGKQNRALLINEKSGHPTERGRTVIDRTPFGRFGRGEDLEGAVLFLASSAASGFITGVTIPVDGGYLVSGI